MKSYQEFRKASQDALAADLDVVLKELYAKSDKQKEEGKYDNNALVANINTMMFKLMDLRLEAYHNWLTAQLEQSPHE